MTSTPTLVIALLALAVAVAAMWWSIPRPPDLDGERWFKTILATMLRGAVDARDGDRDDWVEAVVRFVPYHPAGRMPERKVVRPGIDALPGAAIAGETALLEHLAKRGTVAERWAWMFDEDPVGRESRLADPHDLGPEYEPSAYLRVPGGWELVAAAATDAAPARHAVARLGVQWIAVRGAPNPGRPDVVGAMAPFSQEVPWAEASVEASVARVLAVCNRCLGRRSDRLILVGEGEGIQLVLRALQSDMHVRDRVLAVLSVGGAIGGVPGADGPFGEAMVGDWMERWFSHEHLDTDLVRRIPYLAVQFLDRLAETPGGLGLPLRFSRFPMPVDEGRVVRVIERVDLGPLPVDASLPVDLVARSLRWVTTLWVLSRDAGAVRSSPAGDTTRPTDVQSGREETA